MNGQILDDDKDIKDIAAPPPPAWEDETLTAWQDRESYWEKRPWPEAYDSPIDFLEALKDWAGYFEFPTSLPGELAGWLTAHDGGLGHVEVELPGGVRFAGPAWLAGRLWLAIEERSQQASTRERAALLVGAFLAGLPGDDVEAVRASWHSLMPGADDGDGPF